MVIFDWFKTPVYHILVRGMDVRKALFKYCNKLSMIRISKNMKERKEFEEKTEMRARKKHLATR